MTDSRGIHIRPVYSPDGKTIAYLNYGSREDSHDAGVYLIDADGAGKRRVSDMSAHRVSWSPDGKMILIQAPTGVYIYNLEWGRPMDILKGTARPLDAVFSPDGKKVLFRSNHEGSWQLYSVDLKGENLRRITYLSASSFCVSPLSLRP